MIREVFIVVLALCLVTAPVGAVVEIPGPTDARGAGGPSQNNGMQVGQSLTNTDPRPTMGIKAPDEVTVGETFTLTVHGHNGGGDAGEFSTITVSSPSFDGANEGQRFENPRSGLDYIARVSPGDTIYDANGEQISARHGMVEAGTEGNGVWQAGASHSLSVEITPGETGRLVFYVRTTLTDDDDSTRKFTAPETGDTTDQQGFNVRRVEVQVREEPDITARVDSFGVDGGTHRPGDVVEGTTLVTNTGNRKHEFYVGYSFIGPNGNYYSNQGSTHEAVELAPGETRWVDLRWQIPDDAPAGQYDAATAVWKREEGGKLYGNLDSRQVDNAITVEQGTPEAVVIDLAAPDQSEYEPGDRVETSLTFENTGPIEHPFWADVSVRTPDGNWITGEGRSIELDPGEKRRVTLGIPLPDDAPNGQYDIGAAIYQSKEKDTVSDTAVRRDAITLDSVDQTPRATILATDFARGTYEPGAQVTSAVMVQNTGESAHTFYVGYGAIGPNGNEYDNQGTTHQAVELEPGERRTVDASLTLPSSAPAGEYDLMFSVWRTEEGDKLSGRLDSVPAAQPITVASADLEIRDIQHSPTDVRVGEDVAVSVELANEGARAVTDVLVRVEIGTEAKQRRIDLGGDSTAELTFHVPVQSSGTHSTTVTVHGDDQEVVDEVDIDAAPAVVQVSGRVTDLDGDSIDDATVILGDQATKADSSGRFSFESASTSADTIVVETGERRYERSVDLHPEEAEFIEVVIGSPGHLTITDAPSEYTPGESFEVTATVTNTGEQTGVYEVRLPGTNGVMITDGTTRTVEVTPGGERDVTFTLQQTADYDGDPIEVDLRGPNQTPVDSTSVTLERSRTMLVVTVVDSNGNPIEGVEVGLLNGDAKTTSANGVTRIQLTPPSSDALGTDAEGNWETLLQYRAPEYNQQDIRTVSVARGETNEVIVRLPAQGRVEGTVVANEHGLKDVTVVIGDDSIRTADDGYFQFPEPIQPGNYYVRVKKNDQVILREVISVSKGANSLRLTVPQSRYESATGLDPYVRSVVSSTFGSGSDKVQGQIYGEVTEDSTTSLDGDGVFFTTDDGRYYTTGGCAWYSTEERCEMSGIKPEGDEGSARALSEGVVSGFIYGGEETIEEFEELLRPIEYVKELYALALKLLKELGLLEELLEAIPQQIKEQQRDANPYTPGTAVHTDFASGWYSGYVTFILASSVASGGAVGVSTKFVKSTKTFKNTIDKVEGLSTSAKKRVFRENADSPISGGGTISEFLDSFDSDTATQLRRLHEQGKLRTDTIERLATLKRQSNDFDGAEADALINLYRFRYDTKLVDPDIDDGDLLHIARQGKPSETRLVVKRDGKTVWLEDGITAPQAKDMPGKSGAVGWKHILRKHKGQWLDLDGIENEQDILELMYRVIEEGDRSPNERGIRYVLEYSDEKDIVVVTGDNGFIITAHPDS